MSSLRFVGSLGSIIVKCKDLRIIQLDVPGMEECLNVASSIEVGLTVYSDFHLTFLFIRVQAWTHTQAQPKPIIP